MKKLHEMNQTELKNHYRETFTRLLNGYQSSTPEYDVRQDIDRDPQTQGRTTYKVQTNYLMLFSLSLRGALNRNVFPNQVAQRVKSFLNAKDNLSLPIGDPGNARKIEQINKLLTDIISSLSE